MRSPAFQFYPADWLNDIKLQTCDMAAQGILIGMMCLMHQSVVYGHLMINGLKPDDKTIIKLLRTHHKTFIKGVNQLLLSGALKQDEEGVYYCQRMVKDEKKRQLCRQAGTKGGSPNLGVEYNEPGFVYFIKNSEGLIKIGISASPEKRLYRLKQRFEDRNMSLLDKKWVDDMGKIENLLHEYYKEYNVKGEWFKIPDKALFPLSVLLKVNGKVNPPPSSSSSISSSKKENPRAHARKQKTYQSWQEKKDAEYDSRQPRADPLCHYCKKQRTHMVDEKKKPRCQDCW